MAINPAHSAVTSEVKNQFLQPLLAVFDQVTTRRQCPVESDRDWLLKGVDRVLSRSRSGRDFLQSFQPFWSQVMQVGPYFEKLASTRRLAMVSECSALVRAQVDEVRPSPLKQFTALDAFEVYAGDGHYLAAATHDPIRGTTHWPTGHFFALNLKTQSLFPLTLADSDARKKEHDARALQRQSVATLRQGAGKGRKVLWVWDKAGVNLAFWQERKASGLYFLSQRKTGMRLETVKEREMDSAQPINQGVQSDRVVQDRRGIRVREITFENPSDGQVYVYLTNEMTLQPGLLVLLYKTRWEIEKVFDETKTKLCEQKSWATSDTAKAMQAHFLALTHNLLLLVADRHEEQGVTNTAETERKASRLEQEEKALTENGRSLPHLYKTLTRFTQATFKLIRWLRTYWHLPTSLPQALRQLQQLYASL